MNLSITQTHIDNATPRHYSKCPVALAARSAGIQGAYAGKTWIASTQTHPNSSVRVRYYPVGSDRAAMEAFVKHFDAGKPVAPITLELRKETLSR